MATHNEIGKKGEALAASWLQNQGFSLLHQNWRYSRYEIDIIACKGAVLHIVEVKTSAVHTFGFPEQRVTPRKFEHLKAATSYFLENYPRWSRVQYDILSIRLRRGGAPEYFFIEDCYC